MSVFLSYLKKIYLRRKPPIREVAVTMENRLLFVYYAIAKKHIQYFVMLIIYD